MKPCPRCGGQMFRTADGRACLQCGHRLDPPLRVTPVPERLKGYQGPGRPKKLKLCEDCGKAIAARHYHAQTCHDCSAKRNQAARRRWARANRVGIIE